MSNCWVNFVRAYRVNNPNITYKDALREASLLYKKSKIQAVEQYVCNPVQRKKKQVVIKKKTTEKLVKGELEIDEPIEYITTEIIPKEKNKEYFKECFKTIKDTMDLIYSKSRSKNYEEIMKRLQKSRVFWDLITTNDFYPTPPEVSKIIYNDINKNRERNEKIDIYDITAGLGSLSYYFLENIDEFNSITLIDIAKPFTDLLKCFEKENYKVKVENINALEYEVELPDFSSYNYKNSNTTYFLCNPPFRANIAGKYEKEAWLFFIYHIIHWIKVPYTQQAYFIVPNSTHFTKYNNIEDGIELTIPKETFNRIQKLFKLEDEYEEGSTLYFKKVQDITGFKTISKNGKVSNMGLKTMLIRTLY